ncbi:hypothetical protein ACLI4R_10125 [Natrialbaceae archaeon A-chndr2]
MSDEEPPAGWTVEQRRQYTPADSDREMEYRTYRHDSGDLRVRVAPASIDGEDRPGYAITTTTYPGLEFSESETIRHVLRFEGCDDLARRFMTLFEAQYSGTDTFDAALEYATDRTRASAAHESG